MKRKSGERRRRKAERHGRLAEWMAAGWLLLNGYRIVALRYRTPLGEIDIIARKANLVAFVEVKARAGLMAAVDAVSATAHRRIRGAADLWLARQPDHADISLRFDIVAVMPFRLPRHFRDAF